MPASTRRTIGRYDALVLTSLLWFLAKLLRYAFPPLFETLSVEYGVSTAALGWAFTGFMLVYAAMQFPSGVLADRLGPVGVLTVGAIGAAVGAFVVALEGPFALLVFAMLLVGAGTGVHKTVAIGLLSRTYPARSGRALGVHDTFGTFGGVVAPAIVAVVLGAATADWRVLFFLGGGTAVIVAGAFSIRVPRRLPDRPATHADADERPPLRAYATPFRRRRFVAFVAVTLCFGFAYNGVVAFLPLYLARTTGVSSATASALYALFFVVSLIQLGTGELSDRAGRLPVITGTIGLATASLAALVAVPTAGPALFGVPVLAAAVVATLGVGAHGFRPVRAAHLEALLPENLAGGGLGVVRTGLMGAGAIAPGVVGVLATAAGFRVAFALLLAVLGVALAVVLSLWLTGR
ncbi:major facilitator superfamily protein [Salinarchaeum sp. Harcht-Bsk1]|uniref:MFS transporter n=1 Tax=Salinarchaeum sp. Harcht-Bsk1 TaxID=1333523 RepID=UPI0003423BB5|nr:MFS transporter [Salinarchaeum sp. Harcht-Bsk1]AGN02517.1 major facilitator superfamily protein [Salinarchaeum sp. Harcht-Bsk1]